MRLAMTTPYHGPKAGVVNAASGALTELAKQGGATWAQNAQATGLASKAGHQLVNGVAKVAPKTVAAAGAMVAAAPAVVVVVAGPVAVLAAGYGVYRLGKWLYDEYA